MKQKENHISKYRLQISLFPEHTCQVCGKEIDTPTTTCSDVACTDAFKIKFLDSNKEGSD